MASCNHFLLSTIILSGVVFTLIDAGRHNGLRSLNDLLIESQSVHNMPPFLGGIPSHAGKGMIQHPIMIAPKKKQIREKKLWRILGKDYDDNWVSVTEPKVKLIKAKSELSDGDLIAELMSLNVSAMMHEKEFRNLTPSVSKLIEKWLLLRASCSVTYIWDDLGNLFWPRWVKRGICGSGKRDLDAQYGPGFVPQSSEDVEMSISEEDEAERSCSWPSGMHCVPSESHTIRVLRWHCYPRRHNTGDNRLKRGKLVMSSKSRGKHGNVNKSGEGVHKLAGNNRMSQRRTRMKCIWIKVPYPVTSECYCSC